MPMRHSLSFDYFTCLALQGMLVLGKFCQEMREWIENPTEALLLIILCRVVGIVHIHISFRHWFAAVPVVQ